MGNEHVHIMWALIKIKIVIKHFYKGNCTCKIYLMTLYVFVESIVYLQNASNGGTIPLQKMYNNDFNLIK